MMINIYKKGARGDDFKRNGIGALKDALSCRILQELSGEYSLTLQYPQCGKMADDIKLYNIIKAEGQLFRIYHISSSGGENIILKVHAKHIFYDLAYFFIDEVKGDNKTIRAALDSIFPKELRGIFKMGTDGDVGRINSCNHPGDNFVKIIFELLNRYSYEIERDNFLFTIKEKIGNINGIRIAYGRNIVGIEITEDTSDAITKIYPLGKNGIEIPEKFIEVEDDNPLKNMIPYPIVKKVEFQGIDDKEILKETAEEYLKANSTPKINMKIDFLPLYRAENYKDYESLTGVEIGDTVSVEHRKLGFKSKLRVIRIERDILNPIDYKVELGNPKNTILKAIDKSDIMERINNLSMESSDISTIYKCNKTEKVFSTTASDTIFQFETFTSDNINMTLNITGVSSDEQVLQIDIYLDNIKLPMNPKQRLGKGDNVLSLSYVIVQVGRGAHNIKFSMKTSNGEFRVKKGQFIMILQGKSLQGGIGAEPPAPYIKEKLNYKESMGIYKEGIKEKFLINMNEVYSVDLISDKITVEDCIKRESIKDKYIISFEVED